MPEVASVSYPPSRPASHPGQSRSFGVLMGLRFGVDVGSTACDRAGCSRLLVFPVSK